MDVVDVAGIGSFPGPLETGPRSEAATSEDDDMERDGRRFPGKGKGVEGKMKKAK